MDYHDAAVEVMHLGGEWIRLVADMFDARLAAAGPNGPALFGVPVTTRNWNTITAIAKVLHHKTGE